MIVKRKRPWLRLLFTIRGSSLRQTFPRIAAVTVFSAVVTGAELYFKVEAYSLTVTPFTLIGVALAIFLGFRNNAAYDRYWEGRKLWGQMVNSARSFAREVLMLITSPSESSPSESLPSEREDPETPVRQLQEDLIRRMIAYVHALRHHLRGSAPFEELARFLPGEEVALLQAEKNVPVAILLEIGLRLKRARRDGRLTDFQLATLERTLTTITDVQGGCERIKSTPIPFAYTVLTHRTVASYCFFLPFGLIKTVGWLTPAVVLLISYAFFGLDEIGDVVEQPFGTEPQDLPLTTLCRTIEVNLLQAIEADGIPELLQPVDDVLE